VYSVFKVALQSFTGWLFARKGGGLQQTDEYVGIYLVIGH
jgi:hypothetical protein